MSDLEQHSDDHIVVRDLTMAYGNFIIQHDLNFEVKRGEVFTIMGGSGCGKSTLLRHLIGLKRPVSGNVYFNGDNFWKTSEDKRQNIERRMGVLFQSGALWSSLTLAENVALPLKEYTGLCEMEIDGLVELKLALVGLAGFGAFYPSEISGGMRKRAGLARAISLDPEILFFDEPAAGLDPISSKKLDELILQLRDALGTTIVVVTHELASIFDITDTAIYLDAETKTLIASGNPRDLLENPPNEKVKNFLSRGANESKSQ